MAFVKNLFDKNFIEYASYVIRDRAIPDLEDGLKPVQRRILHTLFLLSLSTLLLTRWYVSMTLFQGSLPTPN